MEIYPGSTCSLSDSGIHHCREGILIKVSLPPPPAGRARAPGLPLGGGEWDVGFGVQHVAGQGALRRLVVQGALWVRGRPRAVRTLPSGGRFGLTGSCGGGGGAGRAGAHTALSLPQDFLDEHYDLPKISLVNNIIHNNEGYGVVLVKPSIFSDLQEHPPQGGAEGAAGASGSPARCLSQRRS